VTFTQTRREKIVQLHFHSLPFSLTRLAAHSFSVLMVVEEKKSFDATARKKKLLVA
jgi:hypothetical protein